MVFDRLFSWARKKQEDPVIPFGRYSDNNKSVKKVQKWTEADNLFKAGEYRQCIDAFFDYLCDDEQQNLEIEREQDTLRFRLYQGSQVIRGEVNGEKLIAETVLASMADQSTPVMRKLLEMNFSLYYSRYALSGANVSMLFDTAVSAATPNKLYYGLKELATKSDKQDDLLISEFSSLQPIDTSHILQIPEPEKEIKYQYLQTWVRSTLDYVATLDAEKFSGAISYLLLTLAFRIDYLITPEGKLMNELEKIASSYYSKDDKSSPERNPAMIRGFEKLLKKSRDDIFAQLFRARYTFSIVVPHNLRQVGEAIETALQNMAWYRDNNYPDLANKVMEYGFAYSQYSYSLPRPLTDLFRLFMHINYGDFFRALGFQTIYYDERSNEFDEDEVEEQIEKIIGYWQHKYGGLNFNTKKLKFDTLVNFNQSFLQEIADMNFD